MASSVRAGEPLIVDIEGNSREDGPGVRSVIFFKGCLLNCLWCQNPESKKSRPELWWDNSKCKACGECSRVCPQAAISQANAQLIDRQLCDLCFKCVEVCAYGALRRVGQAMSIEEIVQKVLRYKPFYDSSGGGVTLSGGEPTMYMAFTSRLLMALKAEGVHTLIETAGQFDLDQFVSTILPHTDMIYFDIKTIDAVEHKRLCGVDNANILRNFRLLNSMSKSGHFSIVPRTPLIPGLLDRDQQIDSLGQFYQENEVKTACLLLNNPSWLQKLGKLGQAEPFDQENPIRHFYDLGDEARVKERLSRYGVEVTTGRMAMKN